MSPVRQLFNVDAAQQVKPAMATAVAAASTTAQVAVIAEIVKGWAAILTVVIGFPTAVLILIYWLLKVRKEWENRKALKELD